MKASGIILLSHKTGRVCFQQRRPKDGKIFWGLWGGKSFSDEIPIETAKREIVEETGRNIDYIKVYPFSYYQNRNFEYQTFVMLIKDEITLNLNEESVGYCWSAIDTPPHPLVYGLHSVLQSNEMKNKIKNMLTFYE